MTQSTGGWRLIRPRIKSNMQHTEHDAWSTPFSFTTPPAPGPAQATTRGNGPRTRIAVLADMSSAEGDGSLQAGYFANDAGSLDTARALGQLVEAGEVDFALCIGRESGWVGLYEGRRKAPLPWPSTSDQTQYNHNQGT